jgi:hypothetical protein
MIINGLTRFVESRETVRWTPDKGRTITVIYRGRMKDIEAAARQFEAAGIPYVIRNTAPIAELETQELPEDIDAPLAGSWEIEGRPEQVSLMQHPKYLRLTEDEQKIIKALVDGKTDLKPSEIASGEKTIEGIEGKAKLTGDALQFYTLLWKGQQNYGRMTWVARHSIQCSTKKQSEISGANIGKLYSTAQLQDEAASYNDGMIDIFRAEVAKAVPSEPAPPGHVWAWLKNGPTVRIIANDRVECQVEYWFDAWPTLLYELLPDPK